MSKVDAFVARKMAAEAMRFKRALRLGRDGKPGKRLAPIRDRRAAAGGWDE